MPDTDRSTARKRSYYKKWMPRMHGAAVQCCMCIVGVFLFLGGLIMFVTGVTLILNYGVFDEDLLPPDLQNDEGKKTVGIILTCCGLFAILISVVASALYLCSRSKTSTINPRELSRIPNTARGTPTNRQDHKRHDRRGAPVKPHTNGTIRTPNTKSIPGSTEVIHSRQSAHRKRNRKIKHRGRRLEEIKEQDAISRKTVEGGVLADEYDDTNMTPRSGSFSSQLTLEELGRNPRIVVATEESGRPPSTDSASTSHMSEISNYRNLDNDKSRRELQFLPDSVRYGGVHYDNNDTMSKDSISLSKEGDFSGHRRDSEESAYVSDKQYDKHQMSTSSFNSLNDKFSAGGNDFFAQGRLPDVSSSDESSAISYKASSYSDIHGEKTPGHASPQVGGAHTLSELEIQTLEDTHGRVKNGSITDVKTVESKEWGETADGASMSSYTQDGSNSKPTNDSFA